MPQAKNHRHSPSSPCKRIQMHIPQTCSFPFPCPNQLLQLCPSLCPFPPFSLHLQLLTYFSPKSSELCDIVLALVLLAHFFYISINAPKLKVNSAVLLHQKPLPLPLSSLSLSLFGAATATANKLNNAAKQTKINNNFNFSFFKGAFLYGSSVFRFVCACVCICVPACICVCVCV